MKRLFAAMLLFGAPLLWADGLRSNIFFVASSDSTITNVGTAISFHKLNWNPIGAVSTCSVQLDSSADGVTWTAGGAIASQSCTATGASVVTAGTFNFVRITVTALSGGGTVSVTWTGYANNPSGGGTPGGSSNQVQYNLNGAFGGIAGTVTNSVMAAVNGAAPAYSVPGIPDGNAGNPVTTTPYTILCDSATATRDRGTTIRFQSGAATVNAPDHTASGCASNLAFVLIDDGAGTLTVNRGGTDTFTVVNGSTNTDGATSFTLTNGQYATLNNGVGAIWEVRIAAGGTLSGSGTTNNVAKFTGASSIGNSSLVDNGTTVSTTEPVNTTSSMSTGTSPPTCAAGTGGVFCAGEGTAPTAAASIDMCYADSTSHTLKCSFNGSTTFFNMPQVIASGTATMTTAAIAAGACGTTVTVSATGVLTTDTIIVAFNAAPAGTNAGLTQWPTANNVNFAYCPGVAETPAAATINWKVVR